MVGDVAVRPVHAHEHDRVAALTLAAYGQLAVDLGPYEATLADVAGRAAAAEVLVAVLAGGGLPGAAPADPGGGQIGARADGGLLGAVTYVPDRHSPYAEFADADAAGIRMLAVAPAAQGRGIGALLVDACIDRAAAAGRTRVVLHTTTDMAAARRLYERRGFRRDPDRDWRPQEGVALIGYVLPVRAPRRSAMVYPAPRGGRSVGA